MKTQTFAKIFWICLLSVSVMGYAQEVPKTWMPDPALRQAIRAEIGLPAGNKLTQEQMQWLTHLNANNRGITDITGLEFAINLIELHLGQNDITDLHPLSKLTQLRGLHIWDVGFNLDLSPLVNLVNLEFLSLESNGITDISPLSNLKKLQRLHLRENFIMDVSPLSGLTNLWELDIDSNAIRDFTPLAGLNLTKFVYDEVCEIPPTRQVSVFSIKDRDYPSVASWPYDQAKDMVKYDYFWGFPHLSYNGKIGHISGEVEKAKTLAMNLRAQNPNMLIFYGTSLSIADHETAFPPDSNMWLRDANGERVFHFEDRWGGWKEYKIDFVKPSVQDQLVESIIAVAECGVFDGIALDVFNNNAISGGAFILQHRPEVTEADIIASIQRIFKETRARVRDDFLIVVNANRTKPTAYAAWINGSVMEPGQDYPGGYTHAGLAELDDTLIWNENNLRKPQFNWSEVFLIESQPADSPDNLRWMRVFTTRALTLSNGYVSIHHEPSHVANEKELWYSFWDAPLGRPVGEKAQLYRNREGLFIREFTNGWGVYNRSGKAQKVQLPEKASGWSSGIQNKRWHTIPDLDGEIYVKMIASFTDVNVVGTVNQTHLADSVIEVNPYDVNKDGNVDIADVKRIALAFNQTGDAIEDPNTDVNGDNTVDVTDLLLVIDNLEATADAPSSIGMFGRLSQQTLERLDSTTLRPALTTLRLRNDGSLRYEHAIAFLENLLAAIFPDKTRLLANYPNPFNPETWIPYHLANPSDVQITIYNTRGSIVRHLDIGHQRKGYYTSRSRAAYWDGKNNIGERVSSGIYFYRLRTDNLSFLRKMVILK